MKRIQIQKFLKISSLAIVRINLILNLFNYSSNAFGRKGVT